MKPKTFKNEIKLKEYFNIKKDIISSACVKLDAFRNEMNIKIDSIEKRFNMMAIAFSVFLLIIIVFNFFNL